MKKITKNDLRGLSLSFPVLSEQHQKSTLGGVWTPAEWLAYFHFYALLYQAYCFTPTSPYAPPELDYSSDHTWGNSYTYLYDGVTLEQFTSFFAVLAGVLGRDASSVYQDYRSFNSSNSSNSSIYFGYDSLGTFLVAKGYGYIGSIDQALATGKKAMATLSTNFDHKVIITDCAYEQGGVKYYRYTDPFHPDDPYNENVASASAFTGTIYVITANVNTSY
jgi:hypothetical protein